MTSDDPIDTELLLLDGRTDFQRSHELRMEAMRAFMDEEVCKGLSRAYDARSRPLRPVERGDLVYVIRRNVTTRRTWREGPGLVLMTQGASTWVIVRGELWRVNAENVRKATSEEQLGIEQVEKFLPDLRDPTWHPNRRRDFWDLSREPTVTELDAAHAAEACVQPTPPDVDSLID